MRLLLIEDDPMIGRAVVKGLTHAGFAVDWVQDGVTARNAIADHTYDLLILDLGLPRVDGLTLLNELRARLDGTPVLIASARDAVSDRVLGLNAGADDYLLKPFHLEELLARVHALLRRGGGSGSPVMTVGAVALDPVRRTVTQAGRDVPLTAREFALLQLLMQRPGAVLSRERIESSMYGWDDEIGSNAVEVHIHNLRRKLGPDAIRNVRGVGYKISM